LVYQTVKSANTATAEDGYQRQITRKQDAQIKYLINQAKIRTSELNCTSIRDFLQVLRDIKADHRGLALDNIEVTAYASPDGTLSFNDKLADQRRTDPHHQLRGVRRGARSRGGTARAFARGCLVRAGGGIPALLK